MKYAFDNYSQLADTLVIPKMAPTTSTTAPKRKTSRLAVVLALALLAAEVVFIYGPSLPDGFVGDDWGLLYQGSQGIIAAFRPAVGSYHYNPLAISARTVMYLVFGMNPVPYHVAALVMFWICGALVMVVAWRLTDRFAIGVLAGVIYIAFGSTYEVAVWAVVSFQQLPALMVYLLGFLAYMYWREQSHTMRSRLWAYAAYIICLVLTPLIYEPAITLVVACALYRFFVLDMNHWIKLNQLPALVKSWVADYALPAVLFALYLLFKRWLTTVTGAAQAPGLSQSLAAHEGPLTMGVLQGFIPGATWNFLMRTTAVYTSPSQTSVVFSLEIVVLAFLLLVGAGMVRFLVTWDLVMILSLIFGLGGIASRHLSIIVVPATILYAYAIVHIGDWARAVALRLRASAAIRAAVKPLVMGALLIPILVIGVQCGLGEVQDWGTAARNEYKLLGPMKALIAAHPQARSVVFVDLTQVAYSRYGDNDYMFLNAELPLMLDYFPGQFQQNQIIAARSQQPPDGNPTVFETPQQLTDWAQQTTYVVLQYEAATDTIELWHTPRPLAIYVNQATSANGAYWATTAQIHAPGFAPSGKLVGYLLENWQPATHPLYGCAAGGVHFVSTDSQCEGQKVIDVEGYLYTTQPAGFATTPIYRCKAHNGVTVSNQVSCDGNINQGLLGYALQTP